MFLNVFYSWLIAQVFHPILLIALSYVLNGSIDPLEPGLLLLFAIASIFISSPCLLLGWLSIGLIVGSGYSVTANFLLWLVTTAILVILNFFALALILYGNFQCEFLFITIPAILSIWIASLIRWRQFQELNIIGNSSSQNEMSFETGPESINNH